MNFKLILKTLFMIAVLALLVVMGMHNQQKVDLKMPPLLKNKQTQPAALMYFAFFAVGLLSGTILTAGGGKKSGKAKVEK